MNYCRVIKKVNNIKLCIGKFSDKYNTLKVDYYLFCIGTNIIIIQHTYRCIIYVDIKIRKKIVT